MATHQVTCHTPDNADADRRIQGVGTSTGVWWNVDQVIDAIESKRDEFWTTTPQGQSVWIEVKQRSSGRKYIKTTADGVEPNNILALPVCRR